MTLPSSMPVNLPADRFPAGSPVAWAAEELRRALKRIGVASGGSGPGIAVALGDDPAAAGAAKAAGVALPDTVPPLSSERQGAHESVSGTFQVPDGAEPSADRPQDEGGLGPMLAGEAPA